MIFSRRNTRKCFEIVSDTNVIYSAILYPDGNPRKLFDLAEERAAPVILLDHSLEELNAVFSKKGLDFRKVTLFLDTYHNIQKRAVGIIPESIALLARDLVPDEGTARYSHMSKNGPPRGRIVTL
jgi:hypothetical protein